MQWARWLGLVLLSSAALDEPKAPPARPVHDGPPAASVLETDASSMAALERRGLSLWRLFGAADESNESLAKTEAWSSILSTLEADVAALDARPGVVDAHPRKHFHTSWLRHARGRFELMGMVPNIAARLSDAAGPHEIVVSADDDRSRAVPEADTTR